MPATLVWGKNLRLESVRFEYGQRESCEVVGDDSGSAPISWSSVKELMEFAKRNGIPGQVWPVYEEIEVESQIPLDEVKERSERLRHLLLALRPEVVSGNSWLEFVVGLAKKGYSMFVMV